MDNMETATKQKTKIPNWLKTIVTIFVSIVILYYYLHHQNWGELRNALKMANVPVALFGVMFPQLILWIFDSLSMQKIVKWYHAPVPYRDIFFIRGASYLLGIVNNSLARGGILLYLMRKADIGARKIMGMQIHWFLVWFWGFNIYLALVTAAAQYLDLGIGQNLNMTAWWIYISVNGYWFIEQWLFWHNNINIGLSKYFINKGNEFWSAWALSRPRNWLLIWAMTLPSYINIFVCYYFVALSFGIKAPFINFMVMVPFTLMLSNIPIAFGGYGTTTFAWTLFFSSHAAPAQIAALSIFIPTARLLFRCVIGAVCIPFTIKELGSLNKRS